MLNYFKFLIKSTNKHGVHSPFVFDIITKCFNIKTSVSKKEMFEKKKQEFLKSKNIGLQISNKKANLLIRLVDYFKPKQILNVGKSNTLETIAIQIGNPKSTIENLKEEVENKNYDFIYFDNNQQEKKILNYFETYLKHKNNDSFFMFNDIHTDKEMSTIWSTIKKNPEVSVTIDTYYFGIVFFRKEQNKEHFTIRV